MSFVIAAPEVMAAAATDLANIGSSISAASAAAAGPTMGILAAAPTRCRWRSRRCSGRTPRAIRR